MVLRVVMLCCILVALVAVDDQEVEPGPYQHRASGLTFSAAIGSLTKRGQRDYQLEKWGTSIGYAAGSGVHADIYVYDLDLQTVTDGIAGEVVVAEFERSCGEITAMQDAGRYADVTVLPDPDVSLAGSFLMRSFGFRLVDQDSREVGELRHSHLLMRGHNGHFLKVRLSYSATANQAGSEALAAIVAELVSQIDLTH